VAVKIGGKVLGAKPEPAKAAPVKKKRNPTKRGYPAKVYARLLQYISEGETLTEACAHEGMPTRWTVNRRTETDEVFRDAYNAALDTSIRNLTEDLPKIAERVLEGEGKSTRAERLQAAKITSDNVKWLASKRLDQYKGDGEGGNVVFNVTGAAALPPVNQPEAPEAPVAPTPLKLVGSNEQ
jgi:hypothetical protein